MYKVSLKPLIDSVLRVTAENKWGQMLTLLSLGIADVETALDLASDDNQRCVGAFICIRVIFGILIVCRVCF